MVERRTFVAVPGASSLITLIPASTWRPSIGTALRRVRERRDAADGTRHAGRLAAPENDRGGTLPRAARREWLRGIHALVLGRRRRTDPGHDPARCQRAARSAAARGAPGPRTGSRARVASPRRVAIGDEPERRPVADGLRPRRRDRGLRAAAAQPPARCGRSAIDRQPACRAGRRRECAGGAFDCRPAGAGAAAQAVRSTRIFITGPPPRACSIPCCKSSSGISRLTSGSASIVPDAIRSIASTHAA